MKKSLLLLTFLALSSTADLAQPAPAPAMATASPSASNKGLAPTPKSGLVLPPEKTQPVRMPKFDKAPVNDGKLDDEVWKQAAVLKDFYADGDDKVVFRKRLAT